MTSNVTVSPRNYAESDQTLTLVHYAFQVLLSVMIVLVNGIVISVLVKYEYLHSPTNWIFGSHAMADIMYGALRPMQALLESNLFVHPTTCVVVTCLSVASGGLSMLHLLLVSVDRYIKFNRPLHYPLIVTMVRTKIVTIATWAIIVLLSLLPILDTKPGFDETTFCSPEMVMQFWFFLSLASTNFFICSTIVIIIYYKIFKLAYSQNIRISHERNIHADGMVELRAIVKSSKLFALLCAYFLASWTPFFIVKIINVIHGVRSVSIHTDRIAVTIGTMNSLGNPLLYVFRQKEVINGIKKQFSCLRRVS